MKGKCSMIYHGVNPYWFRPLRREVVEKFKQQNNFKDKFIIGMVARNQARKAHPRALLAFQKFIQGKEDKTIFLMHACPQDQGWNLDDLINRFGLNKKVFLTMPHNNPAVGISPEQQLMLYNCMDVHVLANEGEGFGLPIIESMSCGVPNLTDDYAAGKELIEDSGAGMLIKSATPIFRGADHNYKRCATDIGVLA